MIDQPGKDGKGGGIDNLLYSAAAEFSCFADLALVSPGEYYKEGEGSLMQAVMDSRAFGRSEEQIVQDCLQQMYTLFPSARELNCTWANVVKLGQSLYREKPGQDKFRPGQATPIPNFFLAGSYTYAQRQKGRAPLLELKQAPQELAHSFISHSAFLA